MAPAAPVALLAQLAVWLGFFVLGYAFMLEPSTHGFGAAFRQAAVTLFSVGTAHAGGPSNRAVEIAAGATWAVVVTLQIAYLPSLYDAFNRREALVAMLESRAGLPAWGPEVLARHQLASASSARSLTCSPDWERWAADLVRDATPRTPCCCCSGRPSPGTPVGGWGLLADSSARRPSTCRSSPEAERRLKPGCACAWVSPPSIGSPEHARLARRPRTPATRKGPISLTLRGVRRRPSTCSTEVGYPMELTAEEAWPNFRGWRVNYETNAYRLADRVVAPPAPWSRDSGRNLRSGPVAAASSAQQRSPAAKVFAAHRPDAAAAPMRTRPSLTRPKNAR